MKKEDDLNESLSKDSIGMDGVNKYGKKKLENYNKTKTKNKIYLILLIILSFLFLFVVIWGFYLLTRKEQTIIKLKDVIRNKLDDIKNLENDLDEAGKELKILLDKNLKMEIEKNEYKKEINCLEMENEELIKELKITRNKFDNITQNLKDGYNSIKEDIDTKCKSTVINNNDYSRNDNSSHDDHSVRCTIF